MLHSEALIKPIRLIVDRLMLRDAEKLESSPVKQVIEEACRHIRIHTGASGATRHGERVGVPTPWQRAKEWLRAIRPDIDRSAQKGDWTKEWVEDQWQTIWSKYRTAKAGKGYPALSMDPKMHYRIHGALTKPESSLFTQIRTGRIGLNQFLHSRNVPGYTSPDCPCGAGEQTVQHMLQCKSTESSRNRLREMGGSTKLEELLSSKKGAKALIRWWMEEKLSSQFMLK